MIAAVKFEIGFWLLRKVPMRGAFLNLAWAWAVENKSDGLTLAHKCTLGFAAGIIIGLALWGAAILGGL